MTAVTIGRLSGTYEVPAGPVPPATVRSRLDRAAREHLAGACEAAAAELPEGPAGEVWLVRHLEVAVDVDLDRTAVPPAVAQAWSRELVVALRSALAGGGAGGDVLRFPSRAAWVARLAAELAAGTAWDRWYLRPFASLRPLPTGRAIAEALVRDGAGEARGVLAELARTGDLERVLLALGPGEARRVAAAVTAPGPVDPAAGRALARDLAGLGTAVRPPDDPHLPGSVLRLLAAAARRRVGLPAGSAGVAAAVVVLADLVAHGADPARLAAAAVSRRWAGALRLAGRRPRDVTGDELAAVELLAALAAGDPGQVEALARRLDPGRAVAAGPDEEVTVATPAGGLLLLWPVVVELWPGAAEAGLQAREAALRRLLVTSRLLGRGRRDGLLRDPVLALLCGLERPPVPARVAEAWADLAAAPVAVDALARAAAAAGGPRPDPAFFGDPEGVPGDAADRFAAAVLARFAARLPGFGGSSPGYLLRNFLDVPATVRLGGDPWEASVATPPLHLVLHMAGIHRPLVELPWTPSAGGVEVRWA